MTLDPSKFAAGLVDLIALEEMKAVLEVKPNFWDVLLYDNKYEILYSRTLKWLLSPHQTHGLGTYFADQVLRLVGYDKGVSRSSTHVDTEWRNLDIVLHDSASDVVLAIENKTVTEEHAYGQSEVSQLDRYFQVVTEDPKYANVQTKLFLFLTPDGTTPLTTTQQREEWRSVSYADLEPAFEGAMLRATWNNDPHTRKIIEDLYFKQRRDFHAAKRLRPIIDAWYADDDLKAAIGLGALYFDLLDRPSLDEQIHSDEDGNSDGDRRAATRSGVRWLWEALVMTGTLPDEAEGFVKQLRDEVDRKLGRVLSLAHLQAAIAYVWQFKPREFAQDQTKNPDLQQQVTELFAHLTGQTEPLDPFEVLEEFRPTLSAARLSGGRQSITLVDAEGNEIWFGGSAEGAVAPRVFHHMLRKGCTLNRTQFRSPLMAAFKRMDMAEFANHLVSTLADFNRARPGSLCGCGARLRP